MRDIFAGMINASTGKGCIHRNGATVITDQQCERSRGYGLQRHNYVRQFHVLIWDFDILIKADSRGSARYKAWLRFHDAYPILFGEFCIQSRVLSAGRVVMNRWTLKELNTMDNITFAMCILSERREVLSQEPPLAKKLKSAYHVLDEIRGGCPLTPVANMSEHISYKPKIDPANIYEEVWKLRDKASRSRGQDSIAYHSEGMGILRGYAMLCGIDFETAVRGCYAYKYGINKG